MRTWPAADAWPQVNDEPLIRQGEGLDPDDERVGTLSNGGIEGRPQILGLSHVEQLRLKTEERAAVSTSFH